MEQETKKTWEEVLELEKMVRENEKRIKSKRKLDLGISMIDVKILKPKKEILDVKS